MALGYIGYLQVTTHKLIGPIGLSLYYHTREQAARREPTSLRRLCYWDLRQCRPMYVYEA